MYFVVYIIYLSILHRSYYPSIVSNIVFHLFCYYHRMSYIYIWERPKKDHVYRYRYIYMCVCVCCTVVCMTTFVWIHVCIYICVCGCRKPPAPPKKNDKDHYLSRILQWLDMCMDLLPVSHSLLWKAMAPLVRWFIFWKVVIFHSNVQLPEGVIVHHIYIYIPGNPKASFFPSFGVDTFFLSLRLCWFDWRPDLKNPNTVC